MSRRLSGGSNKNVKFINYLFLIDTDNSENVEREFFDGSKKILFCENFSSNKQKPFSRLSWCENILHPRNRFSHVILLSLNSRHQKSLHKYLILTIKEKFLRSKQTQKNVNTCQVERGLLGDALKLISIIAKRIILL